jgi:hypothetical protein
MTDGARLATLNAIGLFVAAIVYGLASVVRRVIGLDVGLLVVIGTFVAATALVAVAVFVWHQYATAHGRAARARQRQVRPDVYGAIAGLPFTMLGLLLVSSGIFGLFWAMVTFSLSRAVDGLQRLLFAVIFLGLAAVNIIIARAASE